MRQILCRWLIAACCVALPGVARAQVPQQLRSAEVLVARIEAGPGQAQPEAGRPTPTSSLIVPSDMFRVTCRDG